jgi:type I restriction enzyme S subunit
LQSKSRYFRDGCTGATIPHISKQVLTNIHVSLPSIEDQKRTVKILDQVDALRKKRKQAVELLDDYLESVFLEMFGDPVRNPKGFEVARISDITSHIKDGPHVSPEYADTGVLILSTRNVRPGELVLEDAKYVSQHTFEELTKIFRPQKGDVLVTKGGTTGYAKVVDFDWPFCVWVHIAVLRPTPEIDSIYLEGAMNSDYCYRQSQLYTHGIANRDLGLTRIAKIKLLKPPLEEQQKYASRICSIRMIKQKMISQAEELEIQFQALMQKAFKGQL